MYFRKKAVDRSISVNREEKEPVIRASICTGEKVAGFRDRKTGAFEDVVLIQTPKDFEDFLLQYRLRADEVRTIY